MDKLKVIEEFLFDETISPKKRKDRVDLGYRVYVGLNNVTSKIRLDVMNSFLEKLRKSEQFKEYQIEENVGSFSKRKSICIFKPEWIIYDEIPVLCYAIYPEKENYFNLSVGIKKYIKDVPFQGNWRRDFCRLPGDIIKILCKLYNDLSKSKYWKNLSDKSIQSWWSTTWFVRDDNWIVWLPFPPKYRMKFKICYLNIIENGVDTVSQIYLEVITGLKNTTEHYLDEIAKIYRRKQI